MNDEDFDNKGFCELFSRLSQESENEVVEISRFKSLPCENSYRKKNKMLEKMVK